MLQLLFLETGPTSAVLLASLSLGVGGRGMCQETGIWGQDIVAQILEAVPGLKSRKGQKIQQIISASFPL